ncbi:MAG: hypothetical protein KDB00_11225 [Planctomycetales bacterium]|nr:hypothetical protein [Planctomycetales bacterium]
MSFAQVSDPSAVEAAAADNSLHVGSLHVGAAVVDVTPDQLPVLVNGGFLARSADQVKTRVNARAIVLREGDQQIGLVVVDSCMIPQLLLDEVKQRASQRTKLRPDRIMISATHTHTAPSAFAALGTPADPNYVPLLRERIVESLVAAEANLQPARYGWGTADAAEFTALRRWILRPDRVREDPFGNATVRATMHAATKLDDVTGQSGPEDPELSMIAFESLDGKPIAVLANFSMHYFGDQPISADYFGLFCDGLQKHLSGDESEAESSGRRVVGILSHGCSGDIWRRDYVTWTGKDSTTIQSYTQGLLEIAEKAYESIEFTRDGGIAMAETRLPMRYRVPDHQRLQWAQGILDSLEGELPKTQTQVYAMEQVLLHEMQSTNVVVQGIRIGDIAIATTPNETYALTGLKIKARSPLAKTMVIELANGADGYIPPPEQHHLGGYNTWAARSAGLEVQAEPKIAAAAVAMLEQVTGTPRRNPVQSTGDASKAISDRHPVAYWRMDEMEGPTAIDSSQHQRNGSYEPGVVFYLEGPQSDGFTRDGDVNRCAHFAGGRMHARLKSLGDSYTVAMSFWNGMPTDARETTGWMFSRDHADFVTGGGDHLGIGGTATTEGRVVFQYGGQQPLVGKTEIERWSWNRVTMIRDGKRLRVYLNDNSVPEIDAEVGTSGLAENFFIGGRSDSDSNFEGRIDEVAVFDKAVQPGSAN